MDLIKYLTQFHQFLNKITINDLKTPSSNQPTIVKHPLNIEDQKKYSEIIERNKQLEVKLLAQNQEIYKLQQQNQSLNKIQGGDYQEMKNLADLRYRKIIETEAKLSLQDKELQKLRQENQTLNKIQEGGYQEMKELADQRYRKIIETEAKLSLQDKELQKLRKENKELSEFHFDDFEKQEEINDLGKQLMNKNKKLEELQRTIQEMNEKQRNELKKYKEEIDKLKTSYSLNSPNSPNSPKTKNIEILDSEEVRNLEIIEEIGYGGGGKVFKVSKKKYYALKQMNIQNASHTNLQHFIQEYEIMNMLNHPNILKTHGIFFSDEQLPPSILLEYCTMNLEQAIKKKILTKIQTIYIIYQIAEGMKYVHFREIIHRDLKPSNILISEDGTAKICDFGISRLMTTEEQSMTKGLGTQKFMAPEIINEEDYNEKVDVYSFGVLVYFIISGGELPDIKIKDICEGKNAEIPSSFPYLAQQLIEACWIFDQEERPSFEMICEILDENDYDLLSLNKNEIRDLKRIINEYKTKLPKYSE